MAKTRYMRCRRAGNEGVRTGRNTHDRLPRCSQGSTGSRYVSTHIRAARAVVRYQAKKETYRSNVVGFVRTYNMLRENGLNDNHVRAIRATPFWPLFKAYHKGWVSEKSHKKFDSNVRTLIESFDLGQRSFRIGSQLVELTPDAVAKIFGLPNDGIPIDLNTRVTPSGKFFKRYFVRGQPINRSQVEAALKDAIEGETEEDVKDVARLVCLHFMISLMFTNSNHTLGWFFVQWIENLDQISDYNWALAVHEFLLDSIIRKTHDPASVKGCVPLLLFWLCELLPSIEPIEGRSGINPHFVRWDLGLLRDFMLDNDLDDLEVNEDGVTIFEIDEGSDVESNEAEDLIGVDIPSRKRQKRIVSHANKEKSSKYVSTQLADIQPPRQTRASLQEVPNEYVNEEARRGTGANKNVSTSHSLKQQFPSSRRSARKTTHSTRESNCTTMKASHELKNQKQSECPLSKERAPTQSPGSAFDVRPFSHTESIIEELPEEVEFGEVPETPVIDANNSKRRSAMVNHSLLRRSARKAAQSRLTTGLSQLGINKEFSILDHSELPSNKSAPASPISPNVQDIPKSDLVSEKQNTVNKSDKILLCLSGTLLDPITGLQGKLGFGEESKDVDMGGDVDGINSDEEHREYLSQHRGDTEGVIQGDSSEFVTPMRCPKLIRDLECERDDLSIKYVRSCEVLKSQDRELETLKEANTKLDRELGVTMLHYKRMDYDLDKERSKNDELLAEVSRLRKANISLEAEWSANSVEQASLREYASSLEDEINRLKIAACPVPLFQILSQLTQESKDMMSPFGHLNNMSKLHDKELERANQLEHELFELRARFKVVQEQTDVVVASKEEIIFELRKKVTQLGADLDDLRRTLDGLQVASRQLAMNIEKHKDVSADLALKLDAEKESNKMLQQQNDQLIVQKQSLLRDLNRLAPNVDRKRKDLEPNIMVKNLKKRDRRPKDFGEDFVRPAIVCKRNTRSNKIGSRVIRESSRLITIDIDNESDVVPSAAKKKKGRKMLDISRTNVGKELMPVIRDKLKAIWPLSSPGSYIWEEGNYSVTRDDVEDILREGRIANNVIDAYGRILKTDRRCRSVQQIESCILTTYAWVFLTQNDKGGIQLYLHDVLLGSIFKSGLIFVPLRHEREDHFTLLYINMTEKEWLHLDPNHPRLEGGSDPCFENAKAMRNEITRFLQQMKNSAFAILESKKRICYSARNGAKRTYAKEISRDEELSLRRLAEIDVDFPIRSKRDSPQQEPTSVDCGVAVMFYMRELISGRQLKDHFDPNEMLKMRTHLVDLFTTVEGEKFVSDFVAEENAS